MRLTQLGGVCGTQPIFDAIESTAAHDDEQHPSHVYSFTHCFSVSRAECFQMLRADAFDFDNKRNRPSHERSKSQGVLMSIFDGVLSRTLTIRSSSIPEFLGNPALEPGRLSGREGLNSLFEYELLLKTPDALNLGASSAADFDLDSFIGREITCNIQLDGTGLFTSGGVGASVDHIGAGVR
jgi:hypothetical protein